MHDDLDAYVGRNLDRLRPYYDRGVGFCWPGFLFPQMWFFYRKMYLWAALVSAGPLLIAYAPEFTALGWGTSLVGAFGRTLYLGQARRTIRRIRAETPDEDEARALIARAGGVSLVGAAFGLAFAFSAFVLSLKGSRVFGR